MVRRAYAQRSVFEVLLPDGDKLWSTELRAIDEILDDDVLVDLVDAALRRRHPLSGRRGRLGTPATVVLRLLVLKHLRDWSFDECERESEAVSSIGPSVASIASACRMPRPSSGSRTCSARRP